MKFSSLVIDIRQLDLSLAKRASAAVNMVLSARNWIIGAYLVEFEQNGEDRAKYGQTLIPEVAKQLKAAGVKGLEIPNPKRCRQSYLLYPTIGATLSHLFKNSLENLFVSQYEVQLPSTSEIETFLRNQELSPS